MSVPTISIGLSPTTPAADSGYQNAIPRGDNGTPLEKFSFEVPNTGGVAVKTGDYTALTADCGLILSFDSAGTMTLTLPASIPFAKWTIGVQNVGAGTLTVARNGLDIDGAAANLTLAQGAGLSIATDGSNYFTERGAAVSGMANPMTAKGDLIVGGAGGAAARLGVGTDGYVLVARSSAADGLDWEAQSVSTHAESLTDGSSNFIFAGGDIVTVLGVPN